MIVVNNVDINDIEFMLFAQGSINQISIKSSYLTLTVCYLDIFILFAILYINISL